MIRSGVMACLAYLFLIVLALPAGAGPLSLAVYNDGRILVREVRGMEVPKSGEMEYPGVPETIRPETLSVRSLTAPKGLKLLAAGYRYERISAASLLERFVGRQVQVVLPDPADADARVAKTAVLLSAGPSPVFEVDGKVYVGPYESLLLPELPDGLDREPTLRWKVKSSGPKTQNLEVSYLAGGMGWNADYALVLNQEGSTAAVSAWASIANDSGTTFRDAGLKLVAGEVNRAPQPRNMFKTEAVMAMAVDDGAGGAAVRGVGDYHVYEVPGTVTLERGASRQLQLFSVPEAAVRTELVSTHGVSRGRMGAGPVRQAVESYLYLDNDEKGGLGRPMPAGVVRVYQQDKDGASLLIGEDSISHTAVGSEARIRLGNSFDVSVERVQAEYRKTGKNSASMTWEITVRNGSDRERSLVLRERFGGEWKITDATMKYRKVSAGAVEFDLLLPAGGGATVLRYSVDMS